MIKHFISLQWKSLFRSANLGRSMAIKIFLGFFAVYIMVSFLGLGFALYPILKKVYPEQNPFVSANGLLFNWFVIDLILRFFLQKLPEMSVKPLLTLPIGKSKIGHYVLGKSALSFFNFLPLFAILPFSGVLVAEGYDTVSVLSWALGLWLMAYIVNFLNFIIESASSSIELSFLPIIVVAGALFAVDYFQIVNLSSLVGSAFLYLSEQHWVLLVLIMVLAILYAVNFNMLIRKLYLDRSLKSKKKDAQIAHLEWTRRFGDSAPFLQLDLKLIWRNKRPKSTVFILIAGLLYGLIFYTQPIYQNMPLMLVFVGIFSTGVFLISFGQFIPAWDSAYYKLLMSQNIKYRDYLKSKFVLMVASVVLLAVLGIPYVYFGWKILLVNLAAALYNMGINTYVILFAGSFNKKRIDLSQSAAFNYQGTGAVQWLLGLPLVLLPMIVFALVYFPVGFEAAVASLAVLGLLGTAFHQKLMPFITRKYRDSKYTMISAFEQEA